MKTKIIFITLIAMLAVTALVFQSCNKDVEKTNQPPTCKITSPQNGQKFTQGETVTIAVDATDSDGRITEVKFFIDNISVSSATNFPFNYSWNTLDNNIGNHVLKATSFDNSGSNTSDEISIEITEGGASNTPPTALFTVSPSSGTTSTNFAFDASGCTDNEDPTSNLQVRWDFDGNGSWDTGWDYDKTANHQYGSEGTYTAKLEVKDTEGLTDEYTKSITVSNGGGGTTGTFTDPRDGQTYTTIEIGSQTWFAENLNYEIPNSWWYDNSIANGDIYGRLYTWDAALNACPSGWHLPSDDEWKTLEMALGMSQSEADDIGFRGTDEGEKMKSTTGWNNNGNGTNSSGFNALPGGGRDSSWSSFDDLGIFGYWWSSSEYSGTDAAWARYLTNESGQVYRDNYFYKATGFSVRCVKN